METKEDRRRRLNREANRRWLVRHADEIRERRRKRYYENREKIIAYQRAHPEYSREWKKRNREQVLKDRKEYYQKNKDRILKRERARSKTPEVRERNRLYGIRVRERIRLFIESLKKGKKCKVCGFSDPRALIFHHRDPKTKDMSLAEAIGHGWSKEHILSEVKKCDILCANHHMILHYEERKRQLRARIPKSLS